MSDKHIGYPIVNLTWDNLIGFRENGAHTKRIFGFLNCFVTVLTLEVYYSKVVYIKKFLPRLVFEKMVFETWEPR